jgi:ABC-type molybdate transport system substrate-binding protein
MAIRWQPIFHRLSQDRCGLSRFGLACAFIALFLCGTFAQQCTMTVFTVPSSASALQDIDATSSKSIGITVLPRLGAASVMLQQLERPSMTAVFIYADLQWMGYGEARSGIDRSTRLDPLSTSLRAAADIPGSHTRGSAV